MEFYEKKKKKKKKKKGVTHLSDCFHGKDLAAKWVALLPDLEYLPEGTLANDGKEVKVLQADTGVARVPHEAGIAFKLGGETHRLQIGLGEFPSLVAHVDTCQKKIRK